jgi:hypothetical protein
LQVYLAKGAVFQLDPRVEYFMSSNPNILAKHRLYPTSAICKELMMAQALNSRMSSTVPRTKTAIGHEDNETDSISAYGTARSTVSGKPLSAEEFRKLSAYCTSI